MNEMNCFGELIVVCAPPWAASSIEEFHSSNCGVIGYGFPGQPTAQPTTQLTLLLSLFNKDKSMAGSSLCGNWEMNEQDKWNGKQWSCLEWSLVALEERELITHQLTKRSQPTIQSIAAQTPPFLEFVCLLLCDVDGRE